MKVKLVCFDLDGTLIDAFEDIAIAANFIRSINSLSPLTVSQVRQYVGHGARKLVSGVLATGDENVIEINHAALVEYYNSTTESNAKIYDGVIETLSQLQSMGIQTAVATNKPNCVTKKVLEELKLMPYLDFVRGEAAGLARKPSPDILHYLMANADAQPEETLMVGDSYVDIQCARAAKTGVVGVTYGQHTREELEPYNPDFLISKINDILNIVSN